MRDDLGWGIGQVAFMPKVYSSGIDNNSDEEIKILRPVVENVCDAIDCIISQGIDRAMNKYNKVKQ